MRERKTDREKETLRKRNRERGRRGAHVIKQPPTRGSPHLKPRDEDEVEGGSSKLLLYVLVVVVVLKPRPIVYA